MLSFPITPLKLHSTTTDEAEPEDYEFEAPKFFDFAREAAHCEAIAVPPAVGEQLGKATSVGKKEDSTVAPSTPADFTHDDSLFEEDTSWFENNKYLMRSPDGMSLYIPIKPTRIFDDADVMGTPFGKYCVQQSAM